MPDVEVDEIVSVLRARIAARRAAGDYPIGMELQLESEFQGMMRAIDRHEIDTSRLGALIDDVHSAAHDMRLDADTDSRLPGGSAAHGATARMVKRHINPLAESVRDLGTTIGTAMTETRRLFEAQSSADERQLLDAIAGVLDRLAVLDHLVELTSDLERRVAQLEHEFHES